MKFIKLQNNGLLDARLIPLMGGTTKRSDETKIGQFGTGLKYALAFLIRNKVQFRIFVGTKEVKMETKKETISGQEFDIVFIDGEKTSITAQMGYDWRPWMIIREIWCNAIDEGGAKREVTEIIEGADETTTFFIEHNIMFAKVWQNWSRYFIQDFEPIYSSTNYSIYSGSDKTRLYKQGVLIKELDGRSVFSYDIKCASLNELREFNGSTDYEILKCLASITDEKIISHFIENCTDDTYEGKMDYNWIHVDFNKAWKDTIGDAKIIHKKAIENIEARGLDIDIASMVVVPIALFKKLTSIYEGIGALRVADKINEFYEIYNQELELKIKQSLAILESCGYFISPELNFIYGIFGDKTTLAKVSLDKKEILVSEQLIDKPLFDIVTMIIEENEHFRTGHTDCSRQFQQHFIDLFTKTLLDKNEVLL